MLTNFEQIVIVIFSFLLGIVLASLCSYQMWGRRRKIVEERFNTVQQELQITREELSHVQGQYSQLQDQLPEQSQLMREARLQLGQEFENLANRIFDHKQKQFDHQNQKTLSRSLDPLKRQIDEFKHQISKNYQQESAERNQLIGKISELQQHTKQIGEDAVNLAQALKGDNKTQGAWGEMVLERVLEESGLHKGREYDTQVSLEDAQGNRRNPDVVIYLPDNKQLVIDAKVSLVDYERYVMAEDEKERQVALRAHIASVRNHIKVLSSKNYEALNGIQSLDFVFIFMPVEAAFMLALQQEPDLFREAYDRHVVLVSPTTLMATMRTVANIWRYYKQHKFAEKIADQAGGLYDQFVLVVNSLDELGDQIAKTQKCYHLTRKRLVAGRGNIVKRVESLRKLGAKTKRNLSVEQLLGVDDDESESLDESVNDLNLNRHGDQDANQLECELNVEK